ncbi:hypothetical protein B0F90DRAFT_1670797 [Multifurca ochricompacta]|uniref:Uncharacterized protein n=1 Tax=Multifurca ochricompacta TaxID=376703 RepID=A0AAD4LXQ8_9AGAM|nr:hypothetical protein B0F90DRAFT_1670797 [Multifurca ochricompacta]
MPVNNPVNVNYLRSNHRSKSVHAPLHLPNKFSYVTEDATSYGPAGASPDPDTQMVSKERLRGLWVDMFANAFASRRSPPVVSTICVTLLKLVVLPIAQRQIRGQRYDLQPPQLTRLGGGREKKKEKKRKKKRGEEQIMVPVKREVDVAPNWTRKIAGFFLSTPSPSVSDNGRLEQRKRKLQTPSSRDQNVRIERETPVKRAMTLERNNRDGQRSLEPCPDFAPTPPIATHTYSVSFVTSWTARDWERLAPGGGNHPFLTVRERNWRARCLVGVWLALAGWFGGVGRVRE